VWAGNYLTRTTGNAVTTKTAILAIHAHPA
jgi:hypothetical protein